MQNLFFCHSHAQVQGTQKFSFAQLFRSLRSKPSFAVRSHRRYAANLFFLAVRSPPRSSLLAQNYFFGPRSFFFCRPVSSAQNFLTCVTHGISAVHFFRILRQKFEFLASSLCYFWLSDHTGQNQLNWPMEAVEPVLRTSSTAYIYLSLHFSSPTPFTLALVASQHLEPSLSHTSTGSQFQNLFNHGASSQSFRD